MPPRSAWHRNVARAKTRKRGPESDTRVMTEVFHSGAALHVVRNTLITNARAAPDGPRYTTRPTCGGAPYGLQHGPVSGTYGAGATTLRSRRSFAFGGSFHRALPAARRVRLAAGDSCIPGSATRSYVPARGGRRTENSPLSFVRVLLLLAAIAPHVNTHAGLAVSVLAHPPLTLAPPPPPARAGNANGLLPPAVGRRRVLRAGVVAHAAAPAKHRARGQAAGERTLPRSPQPLARDSTERARNVANRNVAPA
jgi:hypothetical protein